MQLTQIPCKFLTSSEETMNDVNAFNMDNSNYSRQLKFGMDRILSNEISTRKTGNGLYYLLKIIIYNCYMKLFTSNIIIITDLHNLFHKFF